MDLTSWIVWAILVVEVTALVFIGFWFSLRTLRLFAGATAFILAIAVARFGLTHPEYTRANLVDSFLSGADQVTIARRDRRAGKGPLPASPAAGSSPSRCSSFTGCLNDGRCTGRHPS